MFGEAVKYPGHVSDIVKVVVSFPDPVIRTVIIGSQVWPFLYGVIDPVEPPSDQTKKWLYENEDTSTWFRWMVGEKAWARFG